MNDTSAIFMQLLQSLSESQTQESNFPNSEAPPFEHTLMSLRPLLAPKQQKVLDLMIKMQEVRALIDEISQ